MAATGISSAVLHRDVRKRDPTRAFAPRSPVSAKSEHDTALADRMGVDMKISGISLSEIKEQETDDEEQ